MALLTVGIGDCKVSSDPADTIVTHALGSCIAVVLYDPVTRVAGLLHYMLPDSALDPDKAARRPFMFANTGIPLLLERACQLGAVKSRTIVIATGGAQMLIPSGSLNIGQRNYEAMRAIFSRAGIALRKEDIGGTCSRSVNIAVATGRVQLRVPGRADRIMTAAEGSSCRS
jgi:chemotaxis protein CheD